MTERLPEWIDRIGAAAGITEMTPQLRHFALLIREDLVAKWPERPWVGLTDEEVVAVWHEANTLDELVRITEAKLKEKNNA
jgi:hypothetical protein